MYNAGVPAMPSPDGQPVLGVVQLIDAVQEIGQRVGSIPGYDGQQDTGLLYARLRQDSLFLSMLLIADHSPEDGEAQGQQEPSTDCSHVLLLCILLCWD